MTSAPTVPPARASRGGADRPESGLRIAAVMSLRELLRRWPTVLFMVFMPASYFVVSYVTSDAVTRIGLSVPGARGAADLMVLDRDVKALYLAVLGISVTSSFAALSSVQGAQDVTRRLRLCGLSAGRLLLARSAVLGLVMLIACAVFVVAFVPAVSVASLWRTVLALLVVSAIGVGLGTLVGLLLPRQFEAAMLLIAFAGIQMALGRSGSDAERFLPFWPGVEALKTSVFAPDPAAASYLLLGLAYAAVLFTLSAAVWTRRTHIWRSR